MASSSSSNSSWFADLFTSDRVRALSQQVSTLQGRVWELEEQLEAARAVASRKEEAERALRGENEKLRSEASGAAERCSQLEAEVRCLKAIVPALVESKEAAAKAFDAEKVEMVKELDDLKREMEEIRAGRDAAERANDQLRSEVADAERKRGLLEEEVNALDAEKAETLKELEDLRRKVEETQASKELVEVENGWLQSEVADAEERQRGLEAEIQKLEMDLVALAETKEEAARVFAVEKAGIVKELEDLKKKAEVMQARKELAEGAMDKLRLEVLIAEQKHGMSELEVKRLKMDLAALAEAKEAAVKSSDDLRRKVEEYHATKAAAEEEARRKVAEADGLRAELDKIRASMAKLRESHKDLEAKHSRLTDEKNSVQKALDDEKAGASKLKSRLEELENYNAKKDLAAALVPQRKKGSILSYLCSK